MHASSVGTVLRIMEREARKHHAPVFQVEHIKTTPFKTLVFTLLSSRTKDITTIPIARRLFVQANEPKKMLQIPEKTLVRMLYGIGFYKTKAKHLRKLCRMLITNFQGKVPDTLKELITLPGVGRKTANIVLNISFGKPTIAVDVHVHRISNRLGLVKTGAPEKTEFELEKTIPSSYKAQFNKILVAYGQTICVPRAPFCSRCKLRNRYCRQAGVQRSR